LRFLLSRNPPAEQSEQSEQWWQSEQSEQWWQWQQSEQSEQPEQFLRLSSAFCAASRDPQYSMEQRFLFASVIQVLVAISAFSLTAPTKLIYP